MSTVSQCASAELLDRCVALELHRWNESHGIGGSSWKCWSVWESVGGRATDVDHLIELVDQVPGGGVGSGHRALVHEHL